MVIEPNTPQMNYTVDGLPMSSKDAFKMYARTEEFDSLHTEDKTVIGALNELADNQCKCDFVEDVTTKTIVALETTNKTVAGAINENKEDIESLLTRVGAVEEDVEELTTTVESLVKDKLTLVEAVFTNPNYFTGVATRPVIVNENYVAISYLASVEQDLQYSDGEVEVINLNLNATATLDLQNMPTTFYIPCRIRYFDNNGDFVKNESKLLEARWEQAMGGYDISIYIHDTIDNNGSTTKPQMSFSGIIPYTSVKGV